MTEFINAEMVEGGEVASPMSNAQTERLTHSPDMRSEFSEDIWWLLLRKTKQFAGKEVRRQRWRGAKGGVLPEGYDASAIAAEAVAGLLRKFSAPPRGGLNSERSTLHAASLAALQEELEKSVRSLVNRLHHRKETALVRSEADLAPVPTEDGEVINVAETLPAPQPGPLDSLMAREDEAEFDRFKERFREFLGPDQVLIQLFACYCDCISKPRAIAKELNVPIRAIQDLQRRLQRKLREFLDLRSSGRVKI